MHHGRTQKPIRTPIYLGDERRATRMKRVRERLGLNSDSELVRRLVDVAAEQLGVSEPGDQMSLFRGLGVTR